MNPTYHSTRRACIAKLRAFAAQEGHDGEPWDTVMEAAELLMLECREEDAERTGELPTSGTLHSIDITDEGTGPFRKGKRRAFAMVPPTCPAVDRAFDALLTELIELGICQSPEHDAEIDAILCRARIRVKQQGTELLRRALVFACEEWAAGESCQRKLELLQSLQTQLADPARTLVCDILANGQLLSDSGARYGFPTTGQFNLSKEHCLRLADMEGDHTVGAANPSRIKP